MQALELLAPARNKEIGIAAIDCGADAVYIAGPDFGARKQLRSNSNALDGVSTADLRTLASKRKLRSRGITNDALRKSILKSYMK